MRLSQKYQSDFKNMKNKLVKDIPGSSTAAVKARNTFKNLNELKDEELDEVTGASSAGGFVAPFGVNPDIYKNEEELDEITTASSSGAYSTPFFLAKNFKNWKPVQDPNFPRYGGPGGKYVRIKEKCKRFPYCNQGDINALEFYENEVLNEAISNVSKKTGKSEGYLKNIIINEMMNQRQKDLQRLKKQKNRKYKKRRKFTKEELDEIIRRAIYKSPITSLLGPETLMNVPSGKIYSFDGNKGKK